MKVAASPGMLLLGIWLIVTGLVPLANIQIEGLGTLLNVLAIAAGVMLLRAKYDLRRRSPDPAD